MKKNIVVLILLVLSILFSCFLYLGIELEAKNGIENQAIVLGANRILFAIDKIRRLSLLQLAVFFLIFIYSIYMTIKSR
jgi:hypothetical protein